ncbi:hypothetical protein LCGC14_2154110 [marine sediment metagenome]|uniref:Uncharacterized protein n=1 Tax=marine sediment metagenome TaxID=412755 RepID=A0A0F9DUW6_9ZZZZ
MGKVKKSFLSELFSGLYGLIWRLILACIICIGVYLFLSNFSITGTYTFNADKGINLLFKNFSWIAKQISIWK